ncbi:SRPBCC family protein [Actinopolymorpha sp. NPDC004070]|uniref:SRPBCC family protein n=1 Tax=Actinopolymorpha sp. NPDC004070 TaxID=3154548 RepID=UPI0033A9DD09
MRQRGPDGEAVRTEPEPADAADAADAADVAGASGVVDVRDEPDGEQVIPVHGARVGLERVVDVPPERLWDLLADVTRIGEWSPECVEAHWRDPDRGPVVGARFTATNRFANGGVGHVTCVVTEAARPRTFGWVVLDADDDPHRPGSAWSYELLPADAPGRTRVRHTFVHGPGESGLTAAVREHPERGEAVVAARLAVLRRHMSTTLDRMVAAAR